VWSNLVGVDWMRCLVGEMQNGMAGKVKFSSIGRGFVVYTYE
jgi:hypothetical protein